MTYLIIDTNVCLHFTALDDYPWNQHTDDTEGITIVITHPLIEELDKKKYSGKNHLKQRAIKTLKLIEGIENATPKNGCRLFLYNQDINRNYIESLGLDVFDADDKMLATILKYKEESKNENILLVTNDLGPRLKAAKYGH